VSFDQRWAIARNKRRGLRQHRQHRLHDSCLVSEPSKVGSGPGTASTDDADGTDAIFSARAHPDHSCPCAAFPGKRDLDPNGPQESLRPPQPAGKRPRVFGPCDASKRILASTLRAQPQEVRGAPGPRGPVGHD